MTEQKKEELQSKLKHLKDDFKGKTDLEKEILDHYHYDGFKLILEQMYACRFFTLDEAPPGCPWKKYFAESIHEIIRQTFPFDSNLPDFIHEFRLRCRMIATGKINGTWYLFYCCDSMLSDGRNYFKLFAGGPPDRSPVIPEKLKARNWEIPLDLQLFYYVHNGFGPFSSFDIRMFDAGCILPACRLYSLGEIMNSIQKEQGFHVPYEFDNLLVFFDDGYGNCKCFYRKDNVSKAVYTVAYEHEQREICEKMDFFTCADEILNYFDE